MQMTQVEFWVRLSFKMCPLHYSGQASFCTSLHISPVFSPPPPQPLKLLFYNDSTVNKAPAVFLWNHWLYSFWWWEMSSCSQVLTCVSAFYWNNTWISTLSTEGKTRDKKILVAWRRKRFAFYEQKKMAALGGRGSHYSKTCYKYRGRKTEIGTRQQN